MLVETIIDNAQEFLHDDGAIWPRSELLTWVNDGYRQLLAQSQACVRPFQIDVPGRHTWAGSQEWEDRHGNGIFRKFTFSINSGAVQATSRWEAEMIEGVVPVTSLEGQTYLWERAFSETSDNRFTFIMSKAHDTPVRLYWDDKKLLGASTRELDMLQWEWFLQGGQPIFAYPSNGGRDGSYEVYQMVTDYTQAYDLKAMESGLPRSFAGERTYQLNSPIDSWDYAYTDGGSAGAASGLGLRITGQAADSASTYYLFEWEKSVLEGLTTFPDADPIGTSAFNANDGGADEISLGIGVSRGLSSEDRQYIPAPYDSGASEICGIPRDYKSSESSITVWEIIVPTRTLTESDSLGMIPKQFGKYLKFYVLSRAFSRKGQGFKPDMAQHFTSLFQIGVALLKKIANLSFIDRVYGRQSLTGTPSPRPMQVQFPPSFERQF